MLTAKRKIKILEQVRVNGSVQVETLAKSLNVSSMTIRRDLEKMHKEGLLERCHGGAISKTETKYDDKIIKNRSIKESIAKKAIELIQNGTTVFLDAGTTTLEIAKRIMVFNDLTVVTNDIEIAQFLKNTNVEIFLCGGYLQKTTGSTLGYYATDMLKNFVFDICFIGSASINDDFDILTPTIDKAFLKRLVVQQCKMSYLVADSSKFKRQSINKINSFNNYTGIITDFKFDDYQIDNFNKLNFTVYNV